MHLLRLSGFVLVGFAASAVAAAQTPTLEAFYRLDETSGTTAVDSAGNHDGMFLGGYTLDEAAHSHCLSTSVGLEAAALGYASIPNGPGLSNLLSDLTLAAWVYPETYGTGIMRIFGNNDGAWMCGVRSDGLRFTTRGIQDYDIQASVPLQTWSHIAFVFDADYDVTFYIDGVEVGFVAGGAPANTPKPTWNIGTFNTTVEFWDGLLDDIQLYRGALDAGEVAGLFENPGATLEQVPTVYCTAKTLLVCGPSTIGYSGCPLVGAPAGFVIESRPARGQRSGLMLYSDAGPASIPFHGGTLCVNPAPIRSSVPVRAGGTNGLCNGVLAIDFNAFASGNMGGTPAAFLQVPGTRVNAQWWGRDSVATGSLLSDALEFVLR